MRKEIYRLVLALILLISGLTGLLVVLYSAISISFSLHPYEGVLRFLVGSNLWIPLVGFAIAYAIGVWMIVKEYRRKP